MRPAVVDELAPPDRVTAGPPHAAQRPVAERPADIATGRAPGTPVASHVAAPARPSGRRVALLQFAVCSVALLIVLATVGAFALRHVATAEALRDAEVLTQALGRAVLTPDQITTGVLDGDPAATARFDRAVRTRVLRDPIVRVKVWTEDGRVVYSDLRGLAGQKFPPSPDLREAFADGAAHAELTDLSQPENRFERSGQRLVEVYLPLRAQDDRQVVVEAYHRADSIDNAGQRIWRSFLPVLLALLLALAAAQLPLAWFLARRVRGDERERETLARRGEEAVESERRRIAAVLHDGVVQDLAGAAYELDAGAGRALTAPSETTPQDFAGVMRRSATLCRQSIVTLRALLIDLFPAESHEQELGVAIEALARGLRVRGVEVHVDVDADDLPPATYELVFRVVREALRNVDRHAGARSVHVTVQATGETVSLIVADDGRGMTAEHLDEQHADGHVGLALLADGIAARGGEFLIESEPGAGTQISVELPRH